MKKTLLCVGSAAMLALMSCNNEDSPVMASVMYPNSAEATNPAVSATLPNGVKIYNGGFGSAVAADPRDPELFYMLTDRGPNADGSTSNVKVFGIADFCPQIGVFRLKNGVLTLERTIFLRDGAGNKMNGLPNPAGQGATGETAIDLNGTNLGTSINGIDSEGMALAPDGTFWISDEYGPHICHFAADGKLIEKINPFSTGTRALPKVLATRKANRGMEGLTLTPDGKTLVGMMQSPLLNPNTAAGASNVLLRIVTFDLATGSTRQFVYVMDAASLTGVSDILAVDNDTFYALERDGDYQGGSPAAAVKKVYKFSLNGATDISDPANGANGKLYGGKTVEELKNAAGLATAGIVPVTKTLVLDLLKDIPGGYPHDKAEGLALTKNGYLVISNDDDFGVIPGGANSFAQKILPATGKVDTNKLYFIKITK